MNPFDDRLTSNPADPPITIHGGFGVQIGRDRKPPLTAGNSQ